MNALGDIRRIQPEIPAGDDFLTRAELDALTPDELIRRTTALRPLLEQHAAEAEQLRHPITSVWNEIRKTGCFYHFLPKKYGGLEFDVSSFLNAVVPLTEGCASTGWLVSFCMEHVWMFCQFPKEFQDELFATENGRVRYPVAPGVTAPPGKAVPVDGGYRISGRWRWGTGIMNSDWAMVIAAVPGDKDRRQLFCALPTEEVTVLDTWYIDGMEATGSHDLYLDDVFVPEYRTMNMADMRNGTGIGGQLYDNPIYRQPMTPFLGVTAAIAAVGIGRAALKTFQTQLEGRIIHGTGLRMADRPAAQMRLGHARVAIDNAELLMHAAVNRNVELAARAEPANFEERSHMRLRIAQAVQTCRAAVDSLVSAGGAGAHMRGNPLQRHLRDINVMSNHIMYDIDASTELHGRAMLGLEPNALLY